MAELIRSTISLLILGLVAYCLILVGLALIPVILTVFVVAFAWYYFKIRRLRNQIHRTIREHGDTSFSSAYRTARNEEVIDVEYEEVVDDPKKKD